MKRKRGPQTPVELHVPLDLHKAKPTSSTGTSYLCRFPRCRRSFNTKAAVSLHEQSTQHLADRDTEQQTSQKLVNDMASSSIAVSMTATGAIDAPPPPHLFFVSAFSGSNDGATAAATNTATSVDVAMEDDMQHSVTASSAADAEIKWTLDEYTERTRQMDVPPFLLDLLALKTSTNLSDTQLNAMLSYMSV